MHRILIDTNVVLDAVDTNREHHSEALELLRRCNGGGDMGFTTSLSLKDAYYILNRQYNEEHARRCIHWLCEMLVVAPIGAEECEMSLYSNEPDFEDGLVRSCSELNEVEYIITCDKNAFQLCSLRAIDAATYLQIAASEEETQLKLIGV